MTTCKNCGEEIEFRYVNGVCTPIHIAGTWCSGNSDVASSNSLPKSYEDVCWKTLCPNCKEKEVYFIRHNGGSLWVEALGWPWAKHSCMDNNQSKEPSWYSFFIKNQKGYLYGNVYFGFILNAVRHTLKNGLPRIILAIDTGETGRIVISTEANTSSSYFKGAVVLLNLESRTILVSTHDIKPILEKNKYFSALKLSESWATLRSKR